MPISRNMIY